MTRVSETRQFLLLPIWTIVIFNIQLVKTEVRIPYGMVKDWFPGGAQPQSSKPPYVLDVIRPDGKSVYGDMYQYKPHLFTGLYKKPTPVRYYI